MKKLVLIMALAGMICFPALAMANTISFTTTTPIADTTLTDWTSSLAFQKFNSALGTLTKIELALSSGLDTIITVTNNSTSSGSVGHAKTEVFLSVTDSGGFIVANSLVPQIDKAFPGGLGWAFTLTASPDPGDTATSPLFSASATTDDFFTAAGMLAEFTGAGNILLNAGSVTLSNLSSTGGVLESSQVTHAGLTGTVTYTYLPVPAPSTLLLLGSGLMGLGLLRRKWSFKK